MMSPTVTALKLKPTYDELASFRVREYNDWVISYDGNVDLSKYKEENRLSVVELGMKYKDGNFYYEEVDPQKYKPSKEVVQYFQNQNSFLFRVKKDLQSYGIDIKFFYNNALKRILLTGWQLCKSKEAFEKGKSL